MPFLIDKKIMKINFIIILLIISGNCAAQNLYSGGAGSGVIYLKPLSGASPANLKRGSYVGPHILGDSVTNLLNNLEKEYVYFKPTYGAYAVEEKVIMKRTIYKKVHDFDKYITKTFVDDPSAKQEVTTRLVSVINIGIKLLNFDTNQVEKDIKKLEPADFEKYLLGLQFR